MFGLGCDLVMIDGAIDRKTIASPDTSDAIILATGAVLSRSMKKVVEETAHVVHLYGLPEFDENEKVTEFIRQDNFEHIIAFNDKGEGKVLDLVTGLGAARYIDDAIEDDTRYIFIPGAFTNSVVADISSKHLKQVEFILKDPTKIFVNIMDWSQLRKRGFKVKVLKNIEIAAITVNPWAPQGYTFDSDVLIEEMKKLIPDMPIIDVRK